MIIKYYAKNNYGSTAYYFAEDNAQTRAIQRLTGLKTITEAHSNALQVLGIEWEEVPNPEVKGLGR